MLLLGTISDLTQVVPKTAIIIQNKDDLKVPILLEQIPTSKEFKDSTIQSLSLEQQRFARAYRSMQLAQTLFAICVIQIKPQLEKLLRLNDDSLTKEIKLTQDLLELFITYQVPSDLISFAGNPASTTAEKIDAVKGHVAALQEMLNESKEKEIKAAKEERRYNAGPVAPTRKRRPSWGPRESDFSNFSFASKGSAAVQPKPSLRPGDAISEAESLGLVEEPDYTKIPAELDRRFERFDEDSALRPTIMKVGKVWEKSSQAALLADPSTSSLNTDEQRNEKDRAYDLLDALSRSGCLSIDDASLHVVLSATHRFDQTLMDTIIQQNVNPIEKVERSTLIVASTIQNKEVVDLLRDDQIERVSTYSPMLFGGQTLKSRPVALLEGKKESLEGKKS